MLMLSPLGLIIVGFCLVVFGFVSIFGMVIRVIEPGFILNFVGYGASFVGLLLGIMGVAGLTMGGSNRGYGQDPDHDYDDY